MNTRTTLTTLAATTLALTLHTAAWRGSRRT